MKLKYVGLSTSVRLLVMVVVIDFSRNIPVIQQRYFASSLLLLAVVNTIYGIYVLYKQKK